MTGSRQLVRQEAILRILMDGGEVTVGELAGKLQVSGWTIRRELNRLEELGLVQRHHGGASLVRSAESQALIDTGDFLQNAGLHLAAKQRIGQAAARLLRSSYQHMALGAGTTTTQVARCLKDRQGLFIVTNALNIALDLAHHPGLQVICTGGTVHGDYYTLTGPVAERALKSHYFDVAVIGVSGITCDEGLTVSSQLNAVTLGIMIEHSRRLIVVADHSKIGRVCFAHLAPLAAVDILVTDKRPAQDFCARLERDGVDLIVAS
jgi:DeoR/GlpR family transcriptional regulator of sugar metabolism